MEEADAKLAETHEEDWDEVIPLFLYGTEDQADFLYPLMERAIEKCSRVVDRHAMTPPRSQQKDFKRPQLNRWIDDNYTLIGKGGYERLCHISQRQCGGSCDCSGHIGHAIMDNTIDLKGRVLMRRGHTGLKAAPLINSHINQYTARLHQLEHLPGDELRRSGTRHQYRSDYGIGSRQQAFDIGPA